MTDTVPDLRIRNVNAAPLNARGDFVLYWMIAARRASFNFALDHALALAKTLGKPLVVLEALRVDHPHANDRLHAFVLEGMADNQAQFEASPVHYHPYVEPSSGAGAGLLSALSSRACAVVTDEFPSYFLPRMVEAAGKKLAVRLEAVDSCGLYPLAATDRTFVSAFSFRAHLQKELLPHLAAFPKERPLARLDLPRAANLTRLLSRWPKASPATLSAHPAALATLPVDHSVPPTAFRGGSRAARARLESFVTQKLARYLGDRNEPELDGTSTLSPYLHFGHLSAHEVFSRIASAEGWSPGLLDGPRGGKREGYWHLSAPAEAFLDQVITWRELAYQAARHGKVHDYPALPAWARASLEKHLKDPRPHRYTREELEAGRTHDALWNAAQMQLVRDGWFHGYLRMLWGKRILEWSDSPAQALTTMEALMDKHSLDGRNPASGMGYAWVLGRFDRPWGPERKIFGAVRYMSSENTARKFSVDRYVQKYAP